jgi:hypothetical protein
VEEPVSGAVELPQVAALVLAAAVDALPGRLRRKLDDAVATAASWPVSMDGPRITVRVDEATHVTLSAPTGVLTAADQATCSCLLAPNCLHRAAVLARAPSYDGADEAVEVLAAGRGGGPDGPPGGGPDGPPGGGPGATDPAGVAGGAGPAGVAINADAAEVAEPAVVGGTAGRAVVGGTSGPAGPQEVPVPRENDSPGDPPLSVAQRRAAEQLHVAGIAVLVAGLSGSGAVARAALLRAAHEARVRGLHRASALGRQVAAHLRGAWEGEPQYRLTDLTDDLRDLVAVTRQLAHSGATPAGIAGLVGTARRQYDVRGSLRLYGVCSVPLVTGSGYAGVSTYLADRDGRLWTVTDLLPGDEERAAVAGDAPVALGEAAMSHRELGRAGLVVSGATGSDTGALGAGRAVRAVRATGASWAEPPIAGLWAAPLAEQVQRAFAALAVAAPDRPAGGDLLFIAGRLLGPAPGGVVLLTDEGVAFTLTAPSDHARFAYRANLWRLARAVGVTVRVVGRPDPTRRQHVHLLALATTELATTELATTELDTTELDTTELATMELATTELELPDAWLGRVDLGFDRLTDRHLPAWAEAKTGAPPTEPPSTEPPPTAPPMAAGDLALYLVRRHVERVVAGGRPVQALAAADEYRLADARLATGAALLRNLTAAARNRPRDPFGGPVGSDVTGFADAWLALAVYERAASWAMSEAAWLPPIAAGGR